ncbi:GntR family transcriptional regulator [Rhodococcus sp. WWJCD1]|uniref:FCD domain-containing protein n=1 Tax=Rhodococcus navarretei TaxID=3128981 RepID=A0ABU9CTH1_9NOCA|nr:MULTISPECIES: FCD domain-containing protein [unclassified Rhodococcus (in: high G+C Gram-positive bacteria)]MCJ0893784.1 FCD domain-containing protein [Rhodococcus sp. ARC_M5]OZC45771.1 GntR family transcriptional regulator [Rhodococcus sp. WWJCD1]
MTGYTGRGLHGTTVELLGSRIVDGTITPGETLDLRALGSEMDLSMTALREAIKVLAAKGLLDSRQRRGTFVRDRAAWNVLDSDVIRWRHAAGDAAAMLTELAEVRAIIEPSAAGLAALRRTDDDLADFEAALDNMEAASSAGADQAAAADLAWHAILLRAAHNEMLASMSIFVEPALMVRDSLVHNHTEDNPVPSHRAVVDAIRASDAAGAVELTRALLDKSVDDLSRVLELINSKDHE